MIPLFWNGYAALIRTIVASSGTSTYSSSISSKTMQSNGMIHGNSFAGNLSMLSITLGSFQLRKLCITLNSTKYGSSSAALMALKKAWHSSLCQPIFVLLCMPGDTTCALETLCRLFLLPRKELVIWTLSQVLHHLGSHTKP